MFVNEGEELDKIEEGLHFEKCVRALLNYRTHSLAVNQKRRFDLSRLPERHKRLIEKVC